MLYLYQYLYCTVGIELGVADTNLMKAIAQCTGRTLAQVKADVKRVGDCGLVAEGSRSNQRTMFQPAPLTVSNVYSKLKEIAQMTGQAVILFFLEFRVFLLLHTIKQNVLELNVTIKTTCFEKNQAKIFFINTDFFQSLGKKLDKIQTLFMACRNSEARYLIRSLAGKLRIGLAEQSVLQVSLSDCCYSNRCH